VDILGPNVQPPQTILQILLKVSFEMLKRWMRVVISKLSTDTQIPDEILATLRVPNQKAKRRPSCPARNEPRCAPEGDVCSPFSGPILKPFALSQHETALIENHDRAVAIAVRETMPRRYEIDHIFSDKYKRRLERRGSPGVRMLDETGLVGAERRGRPGRRGPKAENDDDLKFYLRLSRSANAFQGWRRKADRAKCIPALEPYCIFRTAAS
jgi:hypothetical protein